MGDSITVLFPERRCEVYMYCCCCARNNRLRRHLTGCDEGRRSVKSGSGRSLKVSRPGIVGSRKTNNRLFVSTMDRSSASGEATTDARK